MKSFDDALRAAFNAGAAALAGHLTGFGEPEATGVSREALDGEFDVWRRSLTPVPAQREGSDR